MKNEIPFSSIREINLNLKKEKIVYFGAGNIAEKTNRVLNNFNIDFIVDNSSNLWGDEQFDLEVKNPHVIKNKFKNFFVVICTTSFFEVSDQLMRYGYIPNKDFVVSPILNDLRAISNLEKIKRKLIFQVDHQKRMNLRVVVEYI